jgi:TolB-like protein/Tfp pilus assembly protein PilF
MSLVKNISSSVTLAVFPFENLNEGNELDIFCKSFCIDLITELSRFRQFQIISYDSVSGTDLSDEYCNELLQKLDTDYFVKGSFRSYRDQIRINVQLTDSRSRHLVWADRFSGPTENLLDIQEELLNELVSGLQSQLNYELLSSMRKKPSTNVKAYEHWLYGMDELKKGSLENDLKARDHFQKAIEMDPGYSLAYSGMSLTFFNEWSCQLWDRWELTQNGAFEWAQKAIELDEQNYVAAYVLGRLFLYQQAWETSEHYLRRSLRLNSNDTDSLINVAVCFLYLGYADEAFKLYVRAVRLNPAGREFYHPVGAIILYELGKIEEALQLAGKSMQDPYVDYKAYCAAAWFEQGNVEKMNECLEAFLNNFSKLICNGSRTDIFAATEWMCKINPFKNESRIERFWAHITDGKFRVERRKEIPVNHNSVNLIKETGDFWEFEFDGSHVQLVAVKGFIDIKTLISRTGSPVHCAELMGVAVFSHGEQVIDEQARQAYRSKISALQQDIEEAENNRDFEAAQKLQIEYEKLIEHLSGAMGLNGKIRETGSTVEKARSAVTWRIRNAISKIEQAHPSLGKHLSNSIKTGTFCSYEPEKTVEWDLS